jgi:hypothetical protein
MKKIRPTQRKRHKMIQRIPKISENYRAGVSIPAYFEVTKYGRAAWQ